MLKKIALAFDESPEAERALHSALNLAKLASAQLSIITVIESFPAYMGYVSAASPDALTVLTEERHAFYVDLQNKAKSVAEQSGINPSFDLVQGDEIRALLDVIDRIKPDLLVVGLRYEQGGLDRVLGGTAHRLALHAKCDILGVR